MRNQNPKKSEEHPLLKALIAESARRGNNLTELAVALGVTYRRLAQWRTGEADIARASDRVMLASAAYLGVPGVLVLMLSGRISLELLLAPSPEGDAERLQRAMRNLLNEPKFAGIAPRELLQAHPNVQLFVGYLASEVDDIPSRTGVLWKWLHGMAHGATRTEADTHGDSRGGTLY